MADRLTHKGDSEFAVPVKFNTENSVTRLDGTSWKGWQAITNRLADYEETGLTPERCAELAKAEHNPTGIESDLSAKVSTGELTAAIERATAAITGNPGGYVVLRPATKGYGDWINVDDRLPEQVGDYLCVLEYGISGERRRKISKVNYSSTLGTNYSWCIDGIEIVTHWMPLPEPPKEGAR